jgi:hypothetical protein
MLTAEAYLRDGFGAMPAFAGLVAEEDSVIGYVLYHFGYDSDAPTRNFHVVDLYVELGAHNRGVGKAMANPAKIARDGGAEEMIWSVSPATLPPLDCIGSWAQSAYSDVFFMKANASELSEAPP